MNANRRPGALDSHPRLKRRATEPPLPAPPPPPHRRNALWWVAAGLAAVILVAVSSWAVRSARARGASTGSGAVDTGDVARSGASGEAAEGPAGGDETVAEGERPGRSPSETIGAAEGGAEDAAAAGAEDTEATASDEGASAGAEPDTEGNRSPYFAPGENHFGRGMEGASTSRVSPADSPSGE